ncbi:MAG TPA: HAMP domain-containing sensor histidine kinase [Gaiellaceae bacterium]|nr:HAMP domain-containing sensor histidine kinase [Gaiellaceae bacterium]
MSSWRTRPAELCVAAGVVAVAVYFAVPRGSAQSVIYDVIGVGAAFAIGVGVLLNRPSPALPWWLFAAGNLFFAVADIIFNVLVNPPVPSVADGFYLAAYPLVAGGLVLLLFASGGARRYAALVDAGILVCAFVLLQWVFVLDRIVDGSGSTAEIAVSAAYPVMDIVLLAGLAGFFVSAAWRTPSFLLLVTSVVLLLVADEVYGVSPDSYRSGDWVDAGWLLSYVLWAAAALQPTMRELSHPIRRPYRRLRVGASRIAVLMAALLTPPVVLLVQDARGATLEIPAYVIAAIVISIFVMLRLVGILRALEVIRARERSARADAEQAQQLLAAQNERLLEADRLKDEFVALISHDLRTPLTSIMGYIELALDDGLDPPLDEERRSYLEVVSRSSQRLLRLVDDLLFVARLQSGRLDLAPTRLDLNELARQSAQEARARADTRAIEILVQTDGPVPVDADRGRMFQLLDNLVSNAVKFTPDGGRVEICVSREDEAVLEVCDTGVGFTDEEAARVFDRFYRTEAAVERQIPGTGLGLFIAHAITDAHGGRISAHPRDGGGAVFRVQLPLAESRA